MSSYYPVIPAFAGMTEIKLSHVWQFNLTTFPRGCRQKSLLQIITARSWRMAKYDAALLA